MCKNILGTNFSVHSKLSYMRSSYDMCAHADSLEGTLTTTDTDTKVVNIIMLGWRETTN